MISSIMSIVTNQEHSHTNSNSELDDSKKLDMVIPYLEEVNYFLKSKKHIAKY